MTGPYHYKRAEEILAEVEAADAVPGGPETVLAIRAQVTRCLEGRFRQGVNLRTPKSVAVRVARG